MYLQSKQIITSDTYLNCMDLKNNLSQYFEQPQVQSAMVEYLQEKGWKYEDMDEDRLMEMMQDIGLIQGALQKIQQKEQINRDTVYDVATGDKTVTVTISKGRKFKSLLQYPEGSKFYITVTALASKQRTSSHAPAETFSLLQTLTFTISSNLLQPSNQNPFFLSIVVMLPNGNKVLHAIKLLQWRHLLCNGKIDYDIELTEYKAICQKQLVSCGILSLQLKIRPLAKINMIPEKHLHNQMTLETGLEQKALQGYHASAGIFWQQFTSIHKSFSVRRIKLLFDTEDAKMMPTSSLITPLYNVRGIQTPSHALRWVGLLRKNDDTNLSITGKQIARRFTSVVDAGSGSLEDHCHLLCSFLLGFGLQAYVARGFSHSGPHSWVITLNPPSLFFYQTTKSTKIDFFTPKVFNTYRSIHSLYNHKALYANIQLDDSLASTKFDLKDETKWMKLDMQQAISKSSSSTLPILRYNDVLVLMPCTLDLFRLEERLEEGLMAAIAAHRKKIGLPYLLDKMLSSIISTSLSSYELTRLYGLTASEGEFKEAIVNYLPNGHSFKAFPLHLQTIDTNQIILELLKQQNGRAVIECKGGQIRFGGRVRIIGMPQNVLAVWVIIAVGYHVI